MAVKNKQSAANAASKIYARCRSCLAPQLWNRFVEIFTRSSSAEELISGLTKEETGDVLPPFLSELARLEWCIHLAGQAPEAGMPVTPDFAVNPSLAVLRLSWKGLLRMPMGYSPGAEEMPEPGDEMVLVWKAPKDGQVMAGIASPEDLLAIKLIVDEIDRETAAAEAGASARDIDAVMDLGVRKGLVLGPRSLIRRDFADRGGEVGDVDEKHITASVFTLQWHITQACDLHCRHCYDRTGRDSLELDQAITILDDFYEFCRHRHVSGQVSFSGGNPLLYPRFPELYRAASERGFGLAILGNPASEQKLEELVRIERPVFYQVSLEGLPEHNNLIRGRDHFDRVMAFLPILQKLGIYSMVMLTLTRDNIQQVLPLAERLRGRVDLFTFNRLSLVGEGAHLQLPSKEEYVEFLDAYVNASRHNEILALKDNLINIHLYRKGLDLFDGCTGYGCGAAFNFISVLPDGEAHACRKFPSLIGNVLKQTISEVYDSEAARRFRAGSRACRSCSIRHVCGGCLASSHSFGLDLFEERDPFCFMT